MGGGQSSFERRARLGRWMLALAVLVSALGLGSVHTAVLLADACLSAAAMGLLWYDAEPLEPRPAASALALLAMGLTAWTAIQIVPLPRGLLAHLAPETADVWARCLGPLRQDGPSWTTLSLDPTATRVQILRGLTYLAVFTAALRVARRQEGVVFLERVVVGSSVAIAAAALLHPALGAHKVFGLYEPGELLAFDPHHLAPLLNTNHLAAYLDIGLLIAAQSAFERRDSLPRPLAIVILLLLAATVVWTLSRGGAGAMVLGVILAAMMVYAARRSRRTQRFAPTIGLIALIGGASVLFLAAFDDMRAKLAHNDLSKLDLVRTSLGLLRDYGVFGVGRGAFESTFPRLRTHPEYWVNTHPEDVIAQWTTEWGVPVAIIAMVVIAWALRPKTALARSRAPAGAWAALVAVAAHNLVDFSSEVPGVVVALAVCAAIVTGGAGARAGEPRPKVDRWWRDPNAFAVGLGVAMLLALAGTAPFIGDELYNDQRAFRDVGLDRSVGRDAFRERAKQAMVRHPADPYFPFVGAVRAIVARDDSVIPWAARALERSPVYGRVHLIIARSLFYRNPSQARLEYRLACAQDSNLCLRDEGVPLVGNYDDAMEMVPDGLRGVTVLEMLGVHLSERLPSTVVRLDREIVAREPTDLAPVRRVAEAALRDVRQSESWCAVPEAQPTHLGPKVTSPCITEGLEAAQRLRATAPDDCIGHALAAELRVAGGDVEAGFAELEAALDQVRDRTTCARRLVYLALDTHNASRVDAALDRFLKLGCEAPAECVENLIFSAGVENGRGRIWRGLALTMKAWERDPEREDLLAEVAAKAEAQGFHGEALDAYGKLAERHPDDRRWIAAVAREREAVARTVFKP